MTSDQQRVTQIIRDIGRRDDAAEELLPIVYDQLHGIARSRMNSERAGHTLQATALVHEVYVRLIGAEDVAWESRGHFYAAAAQAMRRILIDHARKKNSAKRGGDRRKLPLSVVDLAAEPDPEQIFALDEALTQLEAEDGRAAEVVRLRFFAGLSVEDTAHALGASERTVMREWSFARARLFQLLQEQLDAGARP